MVRLNKYLKIVHPETGKQTIIVLPAPFVSRFPPVYVAEFYELSEERLLLMLVDPDMAQNKKYKLVRGHRTTQTSIPREWLRDRSATPQDVLEMYEDTAQPDRLLIRLRRCGQQLPVPQYADFRRPSE